MPALPAVIAGPIVRRVDASSASIWVALRDPATVEMRVWAGPQVSTGTLTISGNAPLVASGQAQTRRFGDKLHVAVVTAKLHPGSVMPPGGMFSYDLQLGAEGLRTLGLLRDEEAAARLDGVDASAPLHLALGYELDRLPSFVTPPPLVSDLCLAHGSCRKTCGSGPDALAYLDDLIEEHRADIAKRPQQLFLTGDQIYADDLSACLLPQVNSIGADLLGFVEKLPVGGTATDVSLTEFPATRRRTTVRTLGRFTTTDGVNHLLSFGEFAAMYLLVWSPRVWRPLASADDVFVPSTKIAANSLQNWEEAVKDGPKTTAGWRAAAEEGLEKERNLTEIFRAAVPRVARAMANCATYMIFDDHEITDDWYITGSWRSRVLTAPFGRAVIRNGLMAYTVFQAWGNDPAGFSFSGANPADAPKNMKLLDEIAGFATDRAVTTARETALDPLLGLADPTKKPEATFHYSVPGQIHMVRVLDTRTNRTYRSQRMAPPQLLGTSLNAQLPPGPLADGRDLLIVVSAAPVLMARLFDTLLQPASAQVHDLLANIKQKEVAGPDGPPVSGQLTADVEGWAGDEEALEEFIQRLGTYRKAVVLSGDVHFASSLALDYWKGASADVTSRIVQLTSSAARNGAGAAEQAIIRSARVSQQLLRGKPFERLGWTEKSPIAVPASRAISPARRMRMHRAPSLLPAIGWPAGTTIPADKPPDWRWRLTVLRDSDVRSDLERPFGAPPPLPPFNNSDIVGSYNLITLAHTTMAMGPTDPLRTMVFRPNLGLITVAVTGTEQELVHELYSMDAPTSIEGDSYTRHRAALTGAPALPAPQLQVVGDD